MSGHVPKIVPVDVELTSMALAALMVPEGRKRFRELGIGPEIFYGKAMYMAAALLEEREFTQAELVDWWTPEEADEECRELPRGWAGEVDWCVNAVEAVEIIDWFASRYAVAWLPETLRWAAHRIESGVEIRRCLMEVERMIALFDKLPPPYPQYPKYQPTEPPRKQPVGKPSGARKGAARAVTRGGSRSPAGQSRNRSSV